MRCPTVSCPSFPLGPRMDDAAWAAASRNVGAAVEAYFAERGKDLTAPNVRSTVEINTTRVPKRAETLTTALAQLAGVTELTGLRVVEAGSGFGALASYLTVSGGARSLTAIDVREDLLAAARSSTEELGLGDRLRFQLDDMRTLATVPDASADVVFANNSFLYLASRADSAQGMAALARVLAPGGHLLIYQANRWAWREPFTKDPLVHLLPRPVADAVGKWTGWKHNHGRVRLVSPPALMLLARRHGLGDIRTGAPISGGFATGRAAWGSRFFAMTARKH